MIDFCPLASGSSGNSTYIRMGNTSVLVDAGISGIQTKRNLLSIDRSDTDLSAIFLTHGHTDHIASAGVLSRKLDIPIFATDGTWEAIDKRGGIGKVKPENKRYIHSGHTESFYDMHVTAFAISHDCYEPVGFVFENNTAKVAVATDMGVVTKDVFSHLLDASVLLLESNHDKDMLENGPYPRFLKNRIKGMKGHLSNDDCGTLIQKLSQQSKIKAKKIYLGHLSEENNSPSAAIETVSTMAYGKETEIVVANRFAASPLTTLTKSNEFKIFVSTSKNHKNKKVKEEEIPLFTDEQYA